MISGAGLDLTDINDAGIAAGAAKRPHLLLHGRIENGVAVVVPQQAAALIKHLLNHVVLN